MIVGPYLLKMRSNIWIPPTPAVRWPFYSPEGSYDIVNFSKNRSVSSSDVFVSEVSIWDHKAELSNISNKNYSKSCKGITWIVLLSLI